MPRYACFLIGCLLGLTGCQVYYTDPYSGQYDPSRSLESEGFISALYHSMAKRKAQAAAGPARRNQPVRCADSGWRVRKKLARVVRDFQDYGHPAVRYETRGDYFYVYLTGIASADDAHYLAPDIYAVLDEVGQRLSQHSKIRVELMMPTMLFARRDLSGERELQDDQDDSQVENAQQHTLYLAQQIARYLNRYVTEAPISLSPGFAAGAEASSGAFTLAVCAV